MRPAAAGGTLAVLAGPTQRAWPRALAICGVWTLVVLLYALNNGLARIAGDQPPDWGRMLWGSATGWYTIAIFTPVFLWLPRRFPFNRERWLRTAAVWFVALSVVAALRGAIFVPVRQLLFPIDGLTVVHLLRKSILLEVVSLAGIVAIAQALEYGRRLREREVRASQLEARLSQAQLDVLRSELQPHFFFNALHSISTLMHRNVEAADEMLTHLADLLRLSIERRSVQEVPLREELEVLEHYLKIMRVRFGDRLALSVAAEPAVLEERVPLFLLQPLVENAIEHGIAQRAGAGRVAIEARAENGELRLRVSDDGAGLRSASLREGIGLSNTRLRLQQLYGSAAQLSIRGAPEGGTVVDLRLPRRGAASEQKA
jgi:two-component system, LytTR family, sensor kinase